jgi:uncharacterized Zn finger protein (UPF0148 family)
MDAFAYRPGLLASNCDRWVSPIHRYHGQSCCPDHGSEPATTEVAEAPLFHVLTHEAHPHRTGHVMLAAHG